MRNSFIVTYDICEAKRLRLVFRTLRDWGNHLQYSVFECQLTRTELLELKAAIWGQVTDAATALSKPWDRLIRSSIPRV